MNFDYLYRVLLQDKLTGATQVLDEFTSLKNALTFFDLCVDGEFKCMHYEDKQYFDPEILDVAYNDKNYLLLEKISSIAPHYTDYYGNWGKGTYDRYEERYDPIDDYELELYEENYFSQIFSSVESIMAHYYQPPYTKFALADKTNVWYLGCLAKH